MQVPDVNGNQEWSWEVFHRPGFIPKGALCLADMVAQIGKTLYGSQWPDIFAAVVRETTSKDPSGGLVAEEWYRVKNKPRLDAAHNEMISAAISEAQQMLYAMGNVAYVLDADGKRWQVPQRAWAAQNASVVISDGRSVDWWCAGLPPDGWVYVDAAAFAQTTKAALSPQREEPHGQDGSQPEPKADTIAPDAKPDSLATSDRPSRKTGSLKSDLSAQYKAWMEEFLETYKRLPTAKEDISWGKKRGINRERVRGLRRENRPEHAKTGGAPKKVA